ncbi:hypothetical protein [Ruegeria sp. HKCCA5763]|uniref:hypothetical protein n=1 Tax=Ruegeria sp. HKCCA5763 TaxID=2682987 RepID=UPI001489D737|nr:hypothetical protein [Ruegeria sp. HKCCA5763]
MPDTCPPRAWFVENLMGGHWPPPDGPNRIAYFRVMSDNLNVVSIPISRFALMDALPWDELNDVSLGRI